MCNIIDLHLEFSIVTDYTNPTFRKQAFSFLKFQFTCLILYNYAYIQSFVPQSAKAGGTPVDNPWHKLFPLFCSCLLHNALCTEAPATLSIVRARSHQQQMATPFKES
jgi:hypothetical protein